MSTAALTLWFDARLDAALCLVVRVLILQVVQGYIYMYLYAFLFFMGSNPTSYTRVIYMYKNMYAFLFSMN